MSADLVTPESPESLEFEAILLEEATRLANQCLEAAEACRDRWPTAAMILAETAERARIEIARRSAAGYGAATKLAAADTSMGNGHGKVIPFQRRT